MKYTYTIKDLKTGKTTTATSIVDFANNHGFTNDVIDEHQNWFFDNCDTFKSRSEYAKLTNEEQAKLTVIYKGFLIERSLKTIMPLRVKLILGNVFDLIDNLEITNQEALDFLKAKL